MGYLINIYLFTHEFTLYIVLAHSLHFQASIWIFLFPEKLFFSISLLECVCWRLLKVFSLKTLLTIIIKEHTCMVNTVYCHLFLSLISIIPYLSSCQGTVVLYHYYSCWLHDNLFFFLCLWLYAVLVCCSYTWFSLYLTLLALLNCVQSAALCLSLILENSQLLPHPI